MNTRVTNLCEQGAHDRCWDAFAGAAGQYHSLTCYCLCHHANVGAWVDYMRQRDLVPGPGLPAPATDPEPAWQALRAQGLGELELRAMAGDR